MKTFFYLGSIPMNKSRLKEPVRTRFVVNLLMKNNSIVIIVVIINSMPDELTLY